MASRAPHPGLKELVGELELGTIALERRPDAGRIRGLIQMLQNAEYWLSFDVAAFESLLAKSPSPLRELGVAITLRFGDGLDGAITLDELGRARSTLIDALPEDLRSGIALGISSLERAVRARERAREIEGDGFRPYVAAQRLSVHALRAMGRSSIRIASHPDDQKRVRVDVGSPVMLESFDENGRPLLAPEIESKVDAPLWSKDETPQNRRTVIFSIPGEYGVRVPGRATGDRKIVAG